MKLHPNPKIAVPAALFLVTIFGIALYLLTDLGTSLQSESQVNQYSPTFITTGLSEMDRNQLRLTDLTKSTPTPSPTPFVDKDLSLSFSYSPDWEVDKNSRNSYPDISTILEQEVNGVLIQLYPKGQSDEPKTLAELQTQSKIEIAIGLVDNTTLDQEIGKIEVGIDKPSSYTEMIRERYNNAEWTIGKLTVYDRSSEYVLAFGLFSPQNNDIPDGKIIYVYIAGYAFTGIEGSRYSEELAKVVEKIAKSISIK